MLEGTTAVMEAQRGERGRVTIGTLAACRREFSLVGRVILSTIRINFRQFLHLAELRERTYYIACNHPLYSRFSLRLLGSLAEALLAPALVKFQTMYPTVECYARSTDHERMLELLYDGVVELAIITWPCVQPLVTDFKPLLHFHEPVPFVVPRCHPFTTRSAVTQADIVQSATRFLPLRWWQIAPPELMRLAAHARYTANVPQEIAIYLAREGHACGFFTKGYITRALQEGALVEVSISDLTPFYRDSALVRLERHADLSPAAEALVRCIRERAAQLDLLA